MTTKLRTFTIQALGFLMIASPLVAHHTWAVDRTTTVTLKGTVTRFDWTTPHVEIQLEAKTDTGNLEKWTAGGPSPGRMAQAGWSKNSLKAGDVITVVGHRATDGSNLLRIQKVVFPSGRELAGYGQR